MPCSGLGGEGEEAAQWEEKPQKPWRGFEKPSDFICLAPCMKSRHSNRCLQHKHEAIGCSALPIPCSAEHRQRVLLLHYRSLEASTSHVFPRPSSYFTTVSMHICKAATVKAAEELPWVCLGCSDTIFLSTLWRSFTPKQLKHTRLN